MKTWLLLAWCVFASGAAERYDLIIRRGRIMDGSGKAAFAADVAVKGDRIAEIGRVQGEANRTIDAAGLVVAPGFIDMHSHSDWTLLEDGAAQSKIRQGVTTEILGESTSVGPAVGKLVAHKVMAKEGPITIRSLKDYFAAIERNRVAVNVASYVGEGQVWECVMGNSFERPTKAEFEKMKELVAEAMQEGAFGLSTALMMPPSSLATTDDLVELCKVVHQYGGIYSTHMRDEGLGVFDSIKESISIGERAQVPVDILHLKIADQKYWGRMKEVVALIDDARKRGVNVQANIYPYTRGNNDLSSIIPPWAHEGGKEKMLARLGDPEQRARMKKYIREGITGWYNHYTAVGGDWSRMLISANNAYKGMTMDRVIALKREGKNPPPDEFDVLFDVLIESNGSVSTVFAHHTEEDMNLAMAQPWCSIGSDGSALAIEGPLRRGNPHPRSFGTFPRVLGVYARERGLLKMEDAVRKMTSLNAEKIGLRDRGTLRKGAFADITIFDPKTIIDRSTYEDPFHYSEGVRYVVVNGKVELDDGKQTEAYAGRALRHEIPKHSVFVGEAKQLNAKNAGEGPAWNGVEKCLYYVGDDRISRYYPSRDMSEVFSQPSGGANGLLFNREGGLVVCEAAMRRVTRTSTSGSVLVLAASFEGKKFNSPNDVSMDSKGRIYFTDPRYGKRDTMEMREEAVYRIDAPGKVARVITDLERPNGILVSPGDKYLYVADNNNNKVSGARKLWRYDLKVDGSVDVDSKKLIFDWKTSRGPDGFKMDREGRLFVAAGLNEANPPYETVEPYRAGVYVISDDGKLLDFVGIPKDEVTNCSFGGADLKTLYITAGGTLWSIGVKTAGRLPSDSR
ncbi:MAG TPA: SMP-30/gluconolactonase/LRE family protein [Verrucomicrobiae bacterium]